LKKEGVQDVCTCFVDLEKARDRLPREKLWGGLRQYDPEGCLLLLLQLSIHCIPAQKFASLSVASNHDHSPMVLKFNKSACFTTPFHSLLYISYVQPKCISGPKVRSLNEGRTLSHLHCSQQTKL